MPDLRKEISLSTVIALVTLAMAMAGGWTALQTSITGVEAKVGDHDRRLGDIEADSKGARAATSLVLQDIAEIKTDLRYMRQAMERDGSRGK
ncbi:hypothetical protein [Pleomorphomonas koreensis]|uniref:hypothetical protein n=1 Tax=Pleomorphomonas koreensis TaxID=257440 RepID=UPI00047EA089|nr:hypothetical protein [Pleomorphomonas koreensis]